MLRQLLSDPDAFFERKVGDANIRLEILLVIVIGALSLPGVLYVSMSILEAEEAAEMRYVVAGRMLRPVLILFILWFVYALVFHFVSAHYRGRGAPSRVLKGLAWAFVPLGLGNLVKSAGLYLALRDESFNDMLVGFAPADRAQAVFDTAMADPIMIGATIVFAATLLWSGYLMAIVVEHAKGITREQAIRVVAIPLLIHLIFVVLSLVQGSPNYGMLL